MTTRPTLAGRPLARFALTIVGVLILLGVVLVVAGPQPARVRLAIVLGFVAAVGFTAAAFGLAARSTMRSLREMSAAVSSMSNGDLPMRPPETPIVELALLAESLNRMTAELRERMREVEDDRRSRDQILAAMDEGVILVESGAVAYVNPGARRLLGRGDEDPRELSPPALARLTREAVEAGEPLVDEIEIGLPPRKIMASAVAVGAPQRVLLVLRDITEARRLESVRRDFVADASHELKTPVAAIRASAETLRLAVRDDPEAAVRFSDRLAREALRLSRIVADLLDLSRLETEEMEAAAVRLERVVSEEVERVRDRAEEAGVEIDAALEPVTVRGDGKDLGLLVANLVDNAVRYTGRGGRVRVETAERDGRAVLTVADTGAGIPTRDLPRVFERFYRVDQARSRETGGTGLGLAIARHVAERHGGSIEVDSELGRGSTFTVELPAIPSPS